MKKAPLHYVVPVLLAVMLLLVGCRRAPKPPGNPPQPERVPRADALADGFRSPPDAVKPWVVFTLKSGHFKESQSTLLQL